MRLKLIFLLWWSEANSHQERCVPLLGTTQGWWWPLVLFQSPGDRQQWSELIKDNRLQILYTKNAAFIKVCQSRLENYKSEIYKISLLFWYHLICHWLKKWFLTRDAIGCYGNDPSWRQSKHFKSDAPCGRSSKSISFSATMSERLQ